MFKKSTASILAAKKNKSMFPTFDVKAPMPVKSVALKEKTEKTIANSIKYSLRKA